MMMRIDMVDFKDVALRVGLRLEPIEELFRGF